MFFLTLVFSLVAASTVILSSSPIPNEAVIGSADLAAIAAKSIGTRTAWATQVLNKCPVVHATVALLNSPVCGNAIRTGGGRLRSITVSAGGFEQVTDPTFVFNFNGATTAANDIAILDNAIAFVLSQGGNGRFATDLSIPWADDGFPSQYISAVFNSVISTQDAAAFWDVLGATHTNLLTSPYAGFTQVNTATSQLVFIIPEAYYDDPALFYSDFLDGVNAWNAATPGTTKDATVVPGATSDINIAFTWNDWTESPQGQVFFQSITGFLGRPLPLLCRIGLSTLRQTHLLAARAFARSSGEPSQSTCQLFPKKFFRTEIQLAENAGDCPRNLGCSACLETSGCVFRKVGHGEGSHGVCLPRSTFNRRNAITECPMELTPYPQFSQEALNYAVQTQNQNCAILSVAPVSADVNIYVHAKITWDHVGDVDPGCQHVIDEVMGTEFFGLPYVAVQAL